MNLIKRVIAWWKAKCEKDKEISLKRESERVYNMIERGEHLFITFNGVRVSEDYSSVESCATTLLHLRRLYQEEVNEE